MLEWGWNKENEFFVRKFFKRLFNRSYMCFINLFILRYNFYYCELVCYIERIVYFFIYVKVIMVIVVFLKFDVSISSV